MVDPDLDRLLKNLATKDDVANMMFVILFISIVTVFLFILLWLR